MDEPRTHYQLSFTSRQALLLFVGLLVALGVAYTLGVLTGLAGREPERAGAEAPRGETVAAAATPASGPASSSEVPAVTAVPTAAADLELPKPVRGISPRARLGAPAAGSAPGSVTRISEPPGSPESAPSASAARPSAGAPASTPALQLFDDEGGAAPPESHRSSRPSGSKPSASAPKAQAPSSRSASARPPSAGGAAGFWVQALSASSTREAKTRRDRLAAHGFPAAVVEGDAPGGGRVYRVRVGPYATREEADRAAARLKAREKLQPWVVPPGK